jgi:hypothetical protein
MGDLLLYLIFVIAIPLILSYFIGPTDQRTDDYLSSKDGNDRREG